MSTAAAAPAKCGRFSWIKWVALAFLLAIGVFAAIVALQPAEYRVGRSATMTAPASALFDQVNDFHRWEGWSPWAKLDPNMKTTFEGPQSGVGAIYKWTGNDDVGEGKMTITESKPNELIRIDLEFITPFASRSKTEFTFEADGAQTRVTWSMAGHNDFIGKAFCLFMDMDEMLGADFDKGLGQMKTLLEVEAKN